MLDVNALLLRELLVLNYISVVECIYYDILIKIINPHLYKS